MLKHEYKLLCVCSDLGLDDLYCSDFASDDGKPFRREIPDDFNMFPEEIILDDTGNLRERNAVA